MSRRFDFKSGDVYRLFCAGFLAVLIPLRLQRGYDYAPADHAGNQYLAVNEYIIPPTIFPNTPTPDTPTPSPTPADTPVPTAAPTILPDSCLDDAAKTSPGVCGCGLPDSDADGDGVIDCIYSSQTLPCGQEATAALTQRVVADTSALANIAVDQANILTRLVKDIRKRYGRKHSDPLERFVKSSVSTINKARAAEDSLIEILPATLIACDGNAQITPVDNTAEKSQMTKNVDSLVKTAKRIVTRLAFFKVVKDPRRTPTAAQYKKIKAAQKATNTLIDATTAKLKALIAKVPDAS